MATKIQLRRDTAANWTSANPTLSSGEAGFETDTNKLKVGDGLTAWASLDYFGAEPYTDADVDTHLNTSSATTDQVLSYDGADYAWIDAGSGALVSQDPASTNCYLIYVGSVEGKLSSVWDVYGVEGLVYDQEFSDLSPALDFIRENNFDSVGISGNTLVQEKTEIVLAFEEGGSFAMIDTSEELTGISNKLWFVSQAAINPAETGGSPVTLGNGGSMIFRGCDQIYFEGDISYDDEIYLIGSNATQFGMAYYDLEPAFTQTVYVEKQSYFYTDGDSTFAIEVRNNSYAECWTLTGGLTCELNSFAYLGDCTISSLSIFENSYVLAGDCVVTGATSIQDHSVFKSSYFEYANTVGNMNVNTGSKVYTDSLAATANGGGSFGGITIAQGDIATKIISGNNFFPRGVQVTIEGISPSYMFHGLPTVDPVDGGNSFYLNSGVLTLSS